MNENPYMMLAKVILPSEMTEYFDLVKVRTDEYAQEQRLHLHLDEKDITPEGHAGLTPNGFYEESCMNDFPIREYRMPEMPRGQVDDTSALESEIDRLVYPLGSAAYMSEASLKNSTA